MNNGEQLIEIICKRLEDKGKHCTDHNILSEIRPLNQFQLNQLVSFGVVDVWQKEKLEKSTKQLQ